MNILMLDTTKQQAYVIVNAGGEVVVSELLEHQKQSENLLVTLEQTLIKADLELNEINAFACVTGPGSFTGIRIGMSTIKAFYSVFNKPLLAGNVFEILCQEISDGVVLLNSTNTTYYYGVIKNSKVTEYDVLDKDIANDKFKDSKIYFMQSEQPQGNVSYNNYETIKNYPFLVNQFFMNAYSNGNFIADENFEPFYIQLSQAEREIIKKETN